MCPDDRFLPQGKQILPEICQVRPMPKPLSMLIDENLTCENHVDTIIHYIKENCVWLPINHCLPPDALHALYYGRQSHFDNCSVL